MSMECPFSIGTFHQLSSLCHKIIILIIIIVITFVYNTITYTSEIKRTYTVLPYRVVSVSQNYTLQVGNGIAKRKGNAIEEVLKAERIEIKNEVTLCVPDCLSCLTSTYNNNNSQRYK